MRLKAIIVSVLGAGCLLGACDEDNNQALGDSGTITIDVTVDPSIASADGATLASLGVDVPEAAALSMTLRDDATGATAEWPSTADYSPLTRFRSGAYTLTVSAPRSPQAPAFTGATAVEVTNGGTTEASVTARVASAIVTCTRNEEALARVFSDITLTVADEEAGGSGPLFLEPGTSRAVATFTMADGRSQRLLLSTAPYEAATHYASSLTATDGAIPELTYITRSPSGTAIAAIELTDRLLDGAAPTLSCSGFTSGATLSLLEGSAPEAPVTVTADSTEPLSALLLHTSGSWLAANGLPAVIDLLDPAQLARAQALGLTLSGNTIDLTRLLQRIAYTWPDNRSTFSIEACDALGRLSSPVTLNVDIRDIDLDIQGFSKVLIGADRATVTIDTDATDLAGSLAIETLGADGQWSRAAIISVTATGPRSRDVTFAIPAGTADVSVRLSYAGKLKGQGVVERYAPAFTLEADAFARRAWFRVSAATPELTATVTQAVRLYLADGSEATVINRDTARGLVEVVGLKPDTRYSVSAAFGPESAGEAAPAITFTTERDHGVPNGDFEDIHEDIRYHNLPSGGRYSQTIVDIFNQQNRTSYTLSAPDTWANTNAKTFCRSASRHNTWYMQPSCVTVQGSVPSGNYGVALTDVAWDTDGPEIPPYTQTSTPYLRYNPNIPAIAHRASGRIWLGTYAFDPSTLTETMSEGVPFTSRPLTLSGYYRYLPCADAPSATGVAEVKVWGQGSDGLPVLIGTGRTLLATAADYTAFSVPVAYSAFGVKAISLTIVIASSSLYGDIASETSHIITTPDPVTATSTGGRLWVDNLTFAY